MKTLHRPKLSNLPLITDIRRQFWSELAIGLFWRTLYAPSNLWGWWRSPHTIKISKTKIIIGAYIFWTLLPISNKNHIVYADPIRPAPHSISYKTLPLLKQPVLRPLSGLDTVWVSKLRPYGTFSNSYDAGQCTWYVASRLSVPDNWGNAIGWGYAAQALGYIISDTPRPGAIAWSVTDSYLGHVAVVEDDGVTISEMNYNGPYSMDSRIPSPGEFRYIYL